MFFYADAQFPDDIALGSHIQTTLSPLFLLFRLDGQCHIPGDNFDIEADLTSIATFSEKDLLDNFGVTWISLVGISFLGIGQKIDWLMIPGFALLGINGIANANFSVGNKWVRGFAGWKNDVFIWRKNLWVFQPNIGLKVGLPESRLTNSSFRCGVTFPAFFGNDKIILKKVPNFNPALFVSIDMYFLFN